MQPPPRTILHVDMDAFFAAIAVLDDPSLRGKPVLTGGTGPRAVVTTASYEARRFGCRSAMPMAQARRQCPQAVCVRVPGERIRQKSGELFAVLDEFSPMVQPVSVDEAFLDITGCDRLLGDGPTVARNIKDTIKQRTGLTASVGVAFNKFLAKLASDLEKPDGLTVITPDNLDAVLLPLGVGKLWGVGPATQRTLEKYGVRTVADLRTRSQENLTRRFGTLGEKLYRLARGIDHRPVVSDGEAKSIGHEQTFAQNIADPDTVRAVLLAQAEQVGRRLRKHGALAKGVTIKIRFGDFETVTRSATLDLPTDLTDELWRAGRRLFDTWADAGFRSVRLIGISAAPLVREGAQLPLFGRPQREKLHQLDEVMDRIRDRFGKRAVHRGAEENTKPSGHGTDT